MIQACPSDAYSKFDNIAAIDGVVLGLPVFLALWWFRTRDTRQNIKQNRLMDSMRMLASDNQMQIEIGVHQLINLAKAAPEFREDIKLAFIKRLKQIYYQRKI